MTNQKLGHSKLPFSLLIGRHTIFEEYVTASDILHVMALMALDVTDDAGVNAYEAAQPSLGALLARCGTEAVSLRNEHREPASLWLHSLACRNSWLKLRSESPMSRTAFIKHYSGARTSDAPAEAKRTSAKHPVKGRVSRSALAKKRQASLR